MARFDAPCPGNENAKNTQWSEAAPPGMRSPDHLWGEYWHRFNTFRIPLFDKEDYFRIAMTIAKDSRSIQEFDRKFEEHNKRRHKELRSMLKNMYWDLEETLPTRAVHSAASDAQNLGCLEHLVRLLNGYILDRKAEMESAKIVVEKQNHAEENSFQEERGLVFVQDETETLIRELSQSPSADPEYEEYLRTGRMPDAWCSQPPQDIDWGYWHDKEYKARQVRHGESDFFTGTNIESLAGASDDAALHALNSDDDVPSIQRVPSLVSNDSRDLEEGNETATHDEQRRRSSISSKSSSTNSAKKRVRFDDDEDINIHEPQRRKLENTLAHAEIAPISPTTRTSFIQAANGSASRKRSRADEDEDDNGFKRQKIESLSPPPSSVSTDHIAGGGSEKVLEEQVLENNDGGRKRQKQKSKSPTSRAISSRNNLNTRSSRRAKSSALWELDSSGKPHST
ncbi:hypothetical protein TGAMA5MH_01668 [Trichoderma gamsii]|uniref:Uncharacterized protein n=1 Tax=Trichoderma gamsii TaxID=398673 RepID=A0A2K0TMG1_9HYPO|nr:hypothetical protein TGAMA5MH_01668 [Trichoderma gamsii]